MKNKIVALRTVSVDDGKEIFDLLLSEGEQILLSFKSNRDRLIITNKKILVIDVQGVSGKKKEYMVIPLSKITAFSCESAGTFDLDVELKIWASGITPLHFGFLCNTDIRQLTQILNNAIC